MRGTTNTVVRNNEGNTRKVDRNTPRHQFTVPKENIPAIQNVNETLKMRYWMQSDNGVRDWAVKELEWFREHTEGESPYMRYEEYLNHIRGIEWSSEKITIRPYQNLFEATVDGVRGCVDTGLLSETIEEGDGYLFAIKLNSKPDCFFGYVLFDADGNVIRARHAFNLDVTNESILTHLNNFGKRVLLPKLEAKNRFKVVVTA